MEIEFAVAWDTCWHRLGVMAGERGITALHLLLAASARRNIEDWHGMTAIMLAATAGYADILGALLCCWRPLLTWTGLTMIA